MSSLKFISYNVRGLRANVKRRKIMRYLNCRKYDVVFLQETHSNESDQNLWQNEYGGKTYYAHGSNGSKGVGIWLRKNSNVIVNKCLKHNEGRYLILDVTYEGNEYTLACVYAPNQDDPDFFKNFFTHVETLPNDYKIIGGDFNLILNTVKDLKGATHGYHANKHAAQFLRNYMADEELVDIWREQHNSEKIFTFKKTRPNAYSARLDFFIISKSLMPYVVNSDIKTQYISDHSNPTVTISPNVTPRGRGYWKLNTSLLKDKKYVESVNQIIDNVTSQNINIKLMWEMRKMEIRGFTIQYSSRVKRAAEAEYSELLKNLEKAEEELDKDPSALNKQEHLAQCKSKINQHDEQKIEKIMFRNKKNWTQYGEKNSAYFFALEKKNYNRKCITRLQKENGEIISDFPSILKEQKRFYENLYREQEKSPDDQFVSNYLNQIQEDFLVKANDRDRFLLEQEISVHEIYDAIMTMKIDKCPGIDGLPIEFYKEFWSKIKEVLLELFSQIYQDNEFHLSARQALISLIGKPGKDPLKLSNWRPLSLLYCDYKIWDKVLANRLAPVLQYIMQPYQTGFMKGCNIADNLSQLLTIIEHSNNNEEDRNILISYDFYKAFDTVCLNSLYKVLEFFSFGENFIRMIKILHKNMSAFVTNNNHWSEEFATGRGLRQGSCTSPFLFICLTQMLGNRIMQNEAIKGVKVGGVEIKLAQFADDLWNPMKFDQSSFDAMAWELAFFERMSGLKINYDKSHFLRLGVLKNTDVTLSSHKPYRWTNDPIKILGLELQTDVQETSELSYESTLTIIQEVVVTWGNRKLSPIGKIMLWNTLCSSILVYKMLVLGTPTQNFFNRIRQLCVQFIWGKGQKKLSTLN